MHNNMFIERKKNGSYDVTWMGGVLIFDVLAWLAIAIWG